MIEVLHYKLHSFGVPLDSTTNIFCDNRSVVTDSTISTSTLNRKYSAICYHCVREVQAAGTVRVGWVAGEYNKADIVTKTMISTKRRHDLISSIFDDDCAVEKPEIHRE